MKSLAVVAAVCSLLVSGAVSTLASSHSSQAHGTVVRGWVFTLILPSLHGVHVHRMVIPLQTGGTDTPTPTGTSLPVTPAPSTTPTPTSVPINNGPDPVTILQKMFNVLALIKTVHFEEIADQQGTQNLHVDAAGDCTSKGPSLKVHVSAKATVSGTAQSSSEAFDLIRVKTSNFWKSKATKKTWQPAKVKNIQPFGFDVQAPIPLCDPTTSGSGSGSGSGGTSGPTDTITNLVNKGAEQYAGKSVWHIHATDISLDPTTNTTTEYPLDWFVEQQHSLLYGYVLSFNDTTQNVTGSLTTKLTKFGEKVSIKKPKKGATKP